MRSFIGHGHSGVVPVTPSTVRKQMRAPFVDVFCHGDWTARSEVPCEKFAFVQSVCIASPAPVVEPLRVASVP
jgi:hypothetical protein